MKILSVNIGERKTIQWKKKVLETGIFKYPVETPIFLDFMDVKKDHVIDRKHHGGINQAVYAYGKNHYPYWKNLYPDVDWHHGMFGENLTVDFLEETEIHVGSVYQLGEAILEVTKPRLPCNKLGYKFNDLAILKQFWNSTKCGVYFKILQSGHVTKNDVFSLLEEKSNQATIAEVYGKKRVEKQKN